MTVGKIKTIPVNLTSSLEEMRREKKSNLNNNKKMQQQNKPSEQNTSLKVSEVISDLEVKAGEHIQEARAVVIEQA